MNLLEDILIILFVLGVFYLPILVLMLFTAAG